MSEVRQSQEQKSGAVDRSLRFLEKYNKVSAAVLTGAGVVLAFSPAPELAPIAFGLAAADVATGGIVKWGREKISERKAKKSKVAKASGRVALAA